MSMQVCNAVSTATMRMRLCYVANTMVVRQYICRVAGAAVLLLLVGCGEREAPQPEYSTVGQFDTTAVEVITETDTIAVRAELAANDDQRALGLMERRQLGKNDGMLFTYDSMQDSTAAFWMFRTRIPLDIAFIDSTGTIVAIRSMAPCDSPYPQACPPYPAGARFQSALEMNQGWFEREGVGVGDRIRRLEGR